MGENEWAYIARVVKIHPDHAIGTVVCATVDIPEMQKTNAKEIAAWMRQGLRIERVPVPWVRLHLFTTTPYVAGGT